MDNKKNLRSIVLGLGIPILLAIVLFMYLGASKKEIPKYSDIIAYMDYTNEHFDNIVSYNISLDSNELTIVYNEPEDKTDGKKDDKTNADSSAEAADPAVSGSDAVSAADVKMVKKTLVYTVPSIELFLNDMQQRQQALRELIASGTLDEATAERYREHPLLKVYDVQPMKDNSLLMSIVPMLIVGVFMVVIWMFLMRRLNGMNDAGKQMSFSKARIKNGKDEKRKATFDDVAGADEEKEELEEIVQFLKEPKKFNDLGAHIPKGVLLVGPPGTGKTLLARAVAGEANVSFFSISGSDFVEMFVGVGAGRVRDLFEQAKKNTPCIVFIDEIDAVGRHRGAGLGGGHDEREQTLNQLLVEMDGFGVNEGVIVIAATNRPDILDPALTRPGRFDRQILVGTPDIKGREEILKVHAKGKPLAPDVDLKTIAQSTAGFTGADLENLLNEAALLAARKDLRAITMEEIEEATIKVVVGTEKKSRKITDKEKKLTAFHEAGHAVVSYYCETKDPVHQISIIPRGMAGGYTMNLPTEDKWYESKTEIIEEIVDLLGGRAAESIALDDISTGASNDIERATKLARSMVTKYGMSEKLGPITFGSSEGGEIFLGRDMGHIKDFSDEVACKIDEEVSDIIHSCLDRAVSILNEHRSQLDEVAHYLIKNEKMSGDEFKRMMNKTAVEF